MRSVVDRNVVIRRTTAGNCLCNSLSMHNAFYQHLPLLLLVGTQRTCNQGIAGHHPEMQNT